MSYKLEDKDLRASIDTVVNVFNDCINERITERNGVDEESEIRNSEAFAILAAMNAVFKDTFGIEPKMKVNHVSKFIRV